MTPPGILLTVAQSARLSSMSTSSRTQLIEAIVAELRAKIKRETQRQRGLRAVSKSSTVT